MTGITPCLFAHCIVGRGAGLCVIVNVGCTHVKFFSSIVWYLDALYSVVVEIWCSLSRVHLDVSLLRRRTVTIFLIGTGPDKGTPNGRLAQDPLVGCLCWVQGSAPMSSNMI